MKGSSTHHGRESSSKAVEILDCTLRERTFGVSMAVGEKLSIASQLDALGVAFIESAMSAGNPKETEYAKLFGSAMKRKVSEPVLFVPENEDAQVPQQFKTVTLRGNCWPSHIGSGLSNKKMNPEENLKAAVDRISRYRKVGKRVFFDAQHFFDGFFEDTEYALTMLNSAVQSGASRVVLCDSRGGSLPDKIERATKLALAHLSSRQDVVVGIHSHNDCGLALANTLAAIKAGAGHAQATINGIGERAGNTDLCQLLPVLVLKQGYRALNSDVPTDKQLVGLKALSEHVSNICGFSMAQQPFVSSRAFAHIDPEHIAEVEKDPESYEVVNPAKVGNSRQLGMDDSSLVLSEMWQLGLYAKDREVVARKVLARMRELEAFGCKFDDAKASVHLLILETIGSDIRPFQVTRWETSTVRSISGTPEVIGTVEVRIGEGENEKKVSSNAKGVGPIHAIDLALRSALDKEFPELKSLKLVSYSLNIVDSINGTAAGARARTEFADEGPAHVTGTQTWATTAVSDDVLDASIKALIDGYRYKLIFRSKTERFALPDWKVALSWRYSERC